MPGTRGGSSRHRCRGRGRLPAAVRAEEGVAEGDELAHDGDKGHLGLLAALAEALLEGGCNLGVQSAPSTNISHG